MSRRAQTSSFETCINLPLEIAKEGLGDGDYQFPNRDRPEASPLASPQPPMDHVFQRGQIHQKAIGRSPPRHNSEVRFYRYRRPPIRARFLKATSASRSFFGW